MATHSVLTIGHSTHSLQEFLDILHSHSVERIADVRSIPKSRHVPQFNSDVLEASLCLAGLGYTHLPTLGGRRHSRKDSVNTGWRNASFRGYADYMATSEFANGLAELMSLARSQTTAVMCAEAVPWRCHRSLIADALLVKGWRVYDIISAAPATPHKPTPFLKVVDGKLTYPTSVGTDIPLLFKDPEAIAGRLVAGRQDGSKHVCCYAASSLWHWGGVAANLRKGCGAIGAKSSLRRTSIGKSPG